MLAYHGNAELKAAILREVEAHEEADQIVCGTYGVQDGGKWVGCAVGCSIHSLARIQGRELNTSDHSLYETEVGVPIALARLQDALFEGMGGDPTFPRRFWAAIRPGADLSRVIWQFLRWLGRDTEGTLAAEYAALRAVWKAESAAVIRMADKLISLLENS